MGCDDYVVDVYDHIESQEMMYEEINEMRRFVEVVHDLFKNAERSGTEVDDPEGTRVITISDTLARQLQARAEDLM